jgi:hypothetical protein
MFQLNMKMEKKVLDALILEMIHGIVEINMILLPAPQDGLAILQLVNVLWLIQEKDLEVDQFVTISAKDMIMVINTDAIPQLVLAISVRKMILDVAQIETFNVLIVPQFHQIQITIINTSATKLIQKIQSVRNAQKRIKKVAKINKPLVLNAIQNKNCLNVMKRHSLVS